MEATIEGKNNKSEGKSEITIETMKPREDLWIDFVLVRIQKIQFPRKIPQVWVTNKIITVICTESKGDGVC